MRTAGIDIGSRTVKLAILQDGQLVTSRKRENSFDPLAICRELLADEVYNSIVATGYGRHLLARNIAAGVVSEIKASAVGARSLYPACRTVIDIGGQDTKAISLDPMGRLQRFEMNDKCAAGTGRFVEVMAMALACRLEEFDALVQSSGQGYSISSTCAVFAESEVVGLIGRGVPRADVARGIVDSIVTRTSVITSKAAIHDQSKTGQRSSSETELFYPICTLSGNSISLEGSPRRH
ncbi:MAG TPA: acyl-CoA dehydratase activase, partial [Terriglobales bacterium]|nr:acyl-CoA dehydratase activase [Terriglobales bacterium]